MNRTGCLFVLAVLMAALMAWASVIAFVVHVLVPFA